MALLLHSLVQARNTCLLHIWGKNHDFTEIQGTVTTCYICGISVILKKQGNDLQKSPNQLCLQVWKIQDLLII